MSIAVYCDHAGRSASDKDPCFIDWWLRDADGGWRSLFHEHFGNAAKFHETTLEYIAEVGWNLDAHLDHAGRNRHRGGVTRTKRGWRFDCPACGRSPRVLHRRMVEEVQDRADRGQLGLDLSELDTPTRTTPNIPDLIDSSSHEVTHHAADHRFGRAQVSTGHPPRRDI